MGETDNDAEEKPPTTWDRVVNVLWAIGFVCLGGAMILWPDVVSSDTDHSRKLVGKILIWLWGWPFGVVIVLIGVGLGWSAFSKSERESPAEK